MKCLATMLVGLSLAGLPTVVTGCDHPVSHDEETHTSPDGTTVHKDQTVTKDNNGNTIKTDTKTVDKP